MKPKFDEVYNKVFADVIRHTIPIIMNDYDYVTRYIFTASIGVCKSATVNSITRKIEIDNFSTL
jgi:hypothetical protein